MQPTWPKHGPSLSELHKTITNGSLHPPPAGKQCECNQLCLTNNDSKTILNLKKSSAKILTKTTQWCIQERQRTSPTSTIKRHASHILKVTFHLIPMRNQDYKIPTIPHCTSIFQTIWAKMWVVITWAFRRWKKKAGNGQQLILWKRTTATNKKVQHSLRM